MKTILAIPNKKFLFHEIAIHAIIHKSTILPKQHNYKSYAT